MDKINVQKLEVENAFVKAGVNTNSDGANNCYDCDACDYCDAPGSDE